MRNLLTSSLMRDADAHTISSKQISSLDLMEKASLAFAEEFIKEVPDKNIPISIYCGNGNNGGDGLAVARLLKRLDYTISHVYIARISRTSSADFNSNLERFTDLGVPLSDITESDLPEDDEAAIIIDALLGSGLNKAVEGRLQEIISHINSSRKKVISIDIPSGLPSEGIIDSGSTLICSTLTITFQRPKINFFFPESARGCDRFSVVPIGLEETFIEEQESPWKLIEESDIKKILKPRKSFSHKGTYGHALIIAGSKETMGAALLCADACLHAGAGLTTACIPESGLAALNSRAPEVMAMLRNGNIPASMLERYSALAIGPGLGIGDETVSLLRNILASPPTSLVLDADASTIFSTTPDLFKLLPSGCILTPHMKEFDRMFGGHKSWWERLETARNKAAELDIIILLKNQYSFIVLPDGSVLINPTGNPAMAVGGMGDVLTGMIVSCLAQGYSAKEAVIVACHIHGKAGDELKAKGMNSIPPRYLIESLPFVINSLS